MLKKPTYEELEQRVTDRKEAEEALRGSEDVYRSLVESSEDSIYLVDKNCNYIFMNQNHLFRFGLPINEILGRNYIDFHSEEATKEFVGKIDQVIESGKSLSYEYRSEKDGRHFIRTLSPVREPAGKINAVTVISKDITERKQAEEFRKLAIQVLELLNQSKERIDVIRDILFLIKESIGIEAVGIRLREGEDFPYYYTDGFERDFVEAERYLCARDHYGEIMRDSQGIPYLECMCGNVICGRTDASLPFFTDKGSFWTNSTTKLLASTTEEDRQARTRNRCHGEGYESVSLIPLRSNGEIIGLLQLNGRRKDMFTLEMIRFFEGIGASIGIALKRKQAEETLQQSQKEHQKLAGKLLTAQETERRRLAREIHDDISQRLAVMAIDAGKLEQQLQKSKTPIPGDLSELKNGLIKLSGDVHSLSYKLHPSIIEDLGLIDAIKSECRSFTKREGIRVNVKHEIKRYRMPNDLAICIYRVVQEGLRNIAKHSQATEASVSLVERGETLQLSIKDNGIGFDIKKTKKKAGLGLASIKERVHIIQGDFSIQSQSGEGTVIEILAPLPRHETKPH